MGIAIPLFNFPSVLPIYECIHDTLMKIIDTKVFRDAQKLSYYYFTTYFVWLYTTSNNYINRIINLFNTVPVKLTKELYYIEYFYKGKYYRIVFPIKGYNNINVIKISNDDVEKYLGPNNDFHGKKLKVKDITDKDTVLITYIKEDDLESKIKLYSKDDDLILN
jgi:hypothetical protein